MSLLDSLKVSKSFRTEVFAFVAVIATIVQFLLTGREVSNETLQMAIGGVMLLALLALVHSLAKPATTAVERVRAPKPTTDAAKKDFRKAHQKSLIGTRRLILLLGAVMYLGYYWLDLMVLGHDDGYVLAIRVGVTAALLLIWPLSYLSGFPKVEMALYNLVAALASLGILAVMAIGGERLLFYYVGLVTVLMFLAFLCQVPATHVAFQSALVLVGYTALLAYIHLPDLSAVDVELSYNYFFLVTSVVIAVFGSQSLQAASWKLWSLKQESEVRQ